MEGASEYNSKDSATKIVVLGQGTVGKSSLTLRFTMNAFAEDYVPTVQDTYRKNFMLEDEMAQLEILDTAGQEDYAVMQDLWIKQGKGFVLVYSITHQDSFEELKKIYAKIQRLRTGDKQSLIAIVGNKLDLADQRKVSTDLARQYAESINALFFETSAKNGKNCSQVFEDLARRIKETERPVKKKEKPKPKSFFSKYCSLI